MHANKVGDDFAIDSHDSADDASGSGLGVRHDAQFRANHKVEITQCGQLVDEPVLKRIGKDGCRCVLAVDGEPDLLLAFLVAELLLGMVWIGC